MNKSFAYWWVALLIKTVTTRYLPWFCMLCADLTCYSFFKIKDYVQYRMDYVSELIVFLFYITGTSMHFTPSSHHISRISLVFTGCSQNLALFNCFSISMSNFPWKKKPRHSQIMHSTAKLRFYSVPVYSAKLSEPLNYFSVG